MVDLNKIIQAKRTINDFVYKTPFALAPKLSKLYGAEVYLKSENLQRTGAYKIRGAYNKIAHLTDEERSNSRKCGQPRPRRSDERAKIRRACRDRNA